MVTHAVKLAFSCPTFILMRFSKAATVGIAPSLKITPWAAHVLHAVPFPEELSPLSR